MHESSRQDEKTTLKRSIWTHLDTRTEEVDLEAIQEFEAEHCVAAIKLKKKK